MKIFDFTDGVRGTQLDEVRIVSFNGGMPVVKNLTTGKDEYVKMTQERIGNSRFDLAVNAGRGSGKNEVLYKPEDYGVEAICFCWGQEHTGYGFQIPGDWCWKIVATDEWIVNGLLNGMLETK